MDKPFPTPWDIESDAFGYNRIVDAKKKQVLLEDIDVELAQRIVTAINKAELNALDTQLRDRCKAFLHKAQMDAFLRQGSPVDDLVAFVISERG